MGCNKKNMVGNLLNILILGFTLYKSTNLKYYYPGLFLRRLDCKLQLFCYLTNIVSPTVSNSSILNLTSCIFIIY